jgi:hypothetical protein
VEELVEYMELLKSNFAQARKLVGSFQRAQPTKFPKAAMLQVDPRPLTFS